MAFTVSVNFTQDALNAESKDAFAVAYGWTATVPDPASTPENPLPPIANPVSKAQFRDQCVKRYIKDTVHWYRVKQAEAAIAIAPVAD